MHKLTDRERDKLAQLDAETRDVVARHKAGTIRWDDYIATLRRINTDKGVILMTKRDIKRTSQGVLDTDQEAPQSPQDAPGSTNGGRKV